MARFRSPASSSGNPSVIPTGGGGGGGGFVCVSVCPGLVHLPGLRQAGGDLHEQHQGFVTRIRESGGWANKRTSKPQRLKHKFPHLLSDLQRATGPRVHLYNMLGQGRGFVNICGVNERINELFSELWTSWK